ncbi:hypothetical protein HYU90_00875 [Candidatus Collierbacteria bacterium]|nr:hypothetical protein [Candidatus Collierbacteria bacterium]
MNLPVSLTPAVYAIACIAAVLCPITPIVVIWMRDTIAKSRFGKGPDVNLLN